MSTEYDEQLPKSAVDEHVEESIHHEEHNNTHFTHEEKTYEAKIEEPEDQIVQEDETRSRHSSTCSSAAVEEEPVEEHHEQAEPVEEEINHHHHVESKEEEPVSKPIDENRHNEENKEHEEDDKPKKVRPLLQRDFTQQSVVKKEPLDDWAREHQGKSNNTKNLIAKFNSGMVLNEKANNGNPSYKTDYGVGTGKGAIQQDVFH